MPHKDLKRRTERAREQHHEDPTVHRRCDAKYKRTLRGQFSYLKVRSKRRGIQVELTLEEFLEIRSKQPRR